jgi:hypothetical protein
MPPPIMPPCCCSPIMPPPIMPPVYVGALAGADAPGADAGAPVGVKA